MSQDWKSDVTKFPRFEGVRTFMRLPYDPEPKGVDVVILGAPFDTTATFRTGARFGPEAVRRISSLLRPAHAYHAVRPTDVLKIVDGGDIPVIPGNTLRSYGYITDVIHSWVNEGAIPITLGGDHGIALAELRALAQVHGPLALIQFDAHLDTWDEYWEEKYTHGTPFRRALEEGLLDPLRSTQIGIRGTVYDPTDIEEGRSLGFEVLTAEKVREIGLEQTIRTAIERAGSAKTFVSFDVDFLDPAYAPGTGTPEIGGFTTFEAQQLLRKLYPLDFVGFDIVEVLPAFDPTETTALAGATVAFEFLSLVASGRKGA
ncbi:agmatinase [Kyrpidia spormannii]|uniref:Agmatinase n=1 Tax=Kyrpidia spormannii TaxID=2055160 RepID=A0A2K8N9X3_9BACL|nr:agmatinase [Kyrpidia spormannii]ATY86114.1 agmatinase [Kyrpidia spormannii]